MDFKIFEFEFGQTWRNFKSLNLNDDIRYLSLILKIQENAPILDTFEVWALNNCVPNK
jgi:hypothetical protein